ncbi:MAG TPA: hypothetical protein VIN38_14705 [Thiobacillus sp.]
MLLIKLNGCFVLYGFVVGPALARLAQRYDSWVFQGKNILDIVHEVIAETAELRRGMDSAHWPGSGGGIRPR